MRKPKSTKAAASQKAQIQDPETQAAALLKKLERERGGDSISLGKAVKGYPTRAVIFGAEPAVQVAFIRQVAATFARLGKAKGKIPMVTAWFHSDKVPSGAEEVARQLMRRRLPFTDTMLVEMLVGIGQMDFISFAPVLEPLVRELEKRDAEGVLSPKIRKLLPRVLSGLLVKGWTEEEKDNWGFPTAGDRKLAGRIQKLLGR